MLDPKKILIKVGPQHLGKGVSYVLAELDKVFPAWPVQPSLIGNIALTAAGFIGGLYAPDPLDEILVIWGGHHSTNLWDYLSGISLGSSSSKVGLKALKGLPSPRQRLVPTRPGLSIPQDIARRKVQVGPYAGGAGAPKFVPGVLRPKFMHGA